MQRRRWLWWLLLAALALALVACSANETAETGGPTSDESETTTAAAVDEATPPSEEVVEAPPVTNEIGPTPMEVPVVSEPIETLLPEPEGAFADAADALEALDSYRYSTLFTFVGEGDGEIEAGSIELTGVVAGPDRKHLAWRDLGEGDTFELIQIEDQAWVFDEEGWKSAPILVAEAMSQAILIYAPSVAWGGIFGELEPAAEYIGIETVNGVSAHHYTSTYAQWGGYWTGSLEDASGDVWLAEEGYPVKYYFSATGVDEEGGRGTVTWRMDLTDVNAELIVEPPVANGS